ncbi:hypothetical protein POTOM_061535 [Populus tomentosa]|uniref:Protein kinase domain-containing protein n=1 Tax=Populus tomentosa TaxID=118781 RepID=A0A8X7XSY9_POPTO|nr:hypothetical protein POTOM_061535 [Populus tomentosa]
MCEGTHARMSPERLDSHTFGSGCVYAGDVWSLGVTLLELHGDHFPFFAAGKKPTNWKELVLVICFGEFRGSIRGIQELHQVLLGEGTEGETGEMPVEDKIKLVLKILKCNSKCSWTNKTMR